MCRVITSSTYFAASSVVTFYHRSIEKPSDLISLLWARVAFPVTTKMAYANKPTSSEDDSASNDCASDGHIVLGDYRNELYMEKKSTPLWRHQDALPPLPIPTLKETCERYLKSVRALSNSEEAYERTKRAVEVFLRKGGIGETLQERLAKRAESQGGNNSWLQGWWNEYSYLGYREPNVIYVSYFYQFRNTYLGRAKGQIRQASAIARAALAFRARVASGNLPPDFQGKGEKRKPLCSTPFKYLFNSCRIPRSGKDAYVVYPASSPGCDTVLVIRKNRFFVCDVTDSTGRLLSIEKIEEQLRRIVDLADNLPTTSVPLGVLTASHRDNWTAARAQLLRDGGAAFLDAVQRTAFALCLDDTSPDTQNSVARALWHGDGKNRWYDKSVQFIVFENGVSGMLGEHSMMDGAATLKMVNWMFDFLDNVPSSAVKKSPTSTSVLVPIEIAPPVSAHTRWAVLNAHRDFQNLVRKHDMSVLTFNGYGSTAIKQMRCSPDAWVQLAIQLAYRMTFGTVRAVYEPVSVRQFRQGRTETVRSVTTASRTWVDAMMARDEDDARALEQQQKRRLHLLRDAASTHVSNIRDSLDGRGCDRHLLGLRLLLRSDEHAEIFTDPSFWSSCHWHVSTSALSSEHLENWGFGQVVSDGIGIAYTVRKSSLRICVASCHDFSSPFRLNLERALLAMRQCGDEPRSKI